VTLRGVVLKRGSRSVHEGDGSIQPVDQRIDDIPGVLESRNEEGNPRPLPLAAASKALTGSFTRGGSARAVLAQSPNGYRRKR